MNRRTLRRFSGIFLIGAAALTFSACTPMAGSDPGYYNNVNQDGYVIFPDGSPAEVRYAITRDMYNQGYYLTFDGNPLVFERPVPGSRDLERVTFWFEGSYDGLRVIVNQTYYDFYDGGWRERRYFDNPGRYYFMPGYLFEFRQQFYNYPRDYWERERDRDRDRDWSRRHEREQWERQYRRDGRTPPMPPIAKQPPKWQAPNRDQGRDRNRDQRQIRQQPGQAAPTPQQQREQQLQQQQLRDQMQERDRQQQMRDRQQQMQQQLRDRQQERDRQLQQQQLQQQQMRNQQQERERQLQQQKLQQQQQMMRQQEERRQQYIRQRMQETPRQQPSGQTAPTQQVKPQQQNPAAPQGRRQKQEPQAQPQSQPQAQPSGPTPEQLKEIRERFRGQQPR